MFEMLLYLRRILIIDLTLSEMKKKTLKILLHAFRLFLYKKTQVVLDLNELAKYRDTYKRYWFPDRGQTGGELIAARLP